MEPLPATDDKSLVLRAHFGDDGAWDALRAAIEQPDPDGFRAYVTFVSDPMWENITIEQLLALQASGEWRSFLFVADETTLQHDERPVLVVDLVDEPGRTFRVIPSQMWAVENNLSIANMDFRDFADAVDDDGIFRDFR